MLTAEPGDVLRGLIHISCKTKVKQVRRAHGIPTQDDFVFVPHSKDRSHSHNPKRHLGVMIDAGRQAKDTGTTEKYRPAMKIVEDVLQPLKDLPGSSLPDVHNLVRQVNRYREKFRLPAPVKNDNIFTLQKAGFPDNLVVEEIRVFINGDEVMHILWLLIFNFDFYPTAKPGL